MSIPANHYRILDIDIQADDATIKKAYKRAALANHPDKTLHLSATEVEQRTKTFKLATTAYETLLDPAKRADYNKTLAQTSRPSFTAATRRPPTPSAATAAPFPHPPPPGTTPQRPDPFQPPKFNYFTRPPPATSPPPPPPPPPPITHPFTTGSPPPTSNPPTPWFHAPVTETPQRTILTFTNSTGWSLSIGVSKKYTWTRRPVLPLLLSTDTKTFLTVKINMRRAAYSPATNSLKDVVVAVDAVPENRDTAFSCIFAENRKDVELCFTIGTVGVVSPTTVPPPLATAPWTWAFDADFGFLIPFYKTLRATHLMFYPHFPSHAVGKDGTVPAREPFPMGSPAAGLVDMFEGMVFVAMTKQFYCQETEREGKKFWQLAAVGSM